ncbi:MAG: metalloregulator ArsR/SmtB family transcription factor [Alicyclobacillus macrosporangiidus]|uniref:ArsR/SmtB family transcription factor n=1 Tax=Alicyclobacillus macrosporangiidus TaxID=392015 RepID=UPI0026F0CA69|nr:metalloregulator ArsR/SmtB family transcription factor [Alicyclobacillus macrosporangiidus]MCL6598724.1 metalloregulator ArsR/SmtB family transcription factor [Alicyclobacillus macrosporangiidus]
MEELQVLDPAATRPLFQRYAVKFKALSDDKRLQILYELGRRGETCVCDLQDALDIPQSSLSYHLKVLVDAGLIHRETRGTWSYYRIDATAVGALLSEQLCSVFQPGGCCEEPPDRNG